jgi:hypothetical protein
MATWYVRSSSSILWAATTAFTLGQRGVATNAATSVRKFRVYEVTTAGTTGGSEPAWNTTVGGTTTDGSVTWTCRNPTTWLNANKYLWRVLTLGQITAGDTIYVSQAHAESQSGNSGTHSTTFGSRDTPSFVLCANDAAEPPTALATGAVVAYVGQINIDSYVYFYGLTFKSGDGAAVASHIVVGSNTSTGISRLVFDHCTFNLAATAGVSQLMVGEQSTGAIFSADFFACTFTFGASTSLIGFACGQVTILGGVVTGTAPATLFFGIVNAVERVLLVAGLDMSLVSGNIYSMSNATNRGSTILFTGCRIHASATFFSGTPSSGSGVFAAVNCSSGVANYHAKTPSYYGTIDDEIATFLTGGATDGTTPASRKMVSTANTKRTQPLYSPWIPHWSSVTGAVTLTVEVFHDSATALKDNQVWLEAMYPGDASSPRSSLVTDASDVLAAGANQDTSSASWTNAAANPNAQKLVVTPTIQMAGLILARVCLAQASKTLYYNHRVIQT